ncbi:MAG: hypothetical protein VX610_11575 [SAR324 cluster bacterium]|nr:hypothetical protein [SAR324 cluster bacterium]
MKTAVYYKIKLNFTLKKNHVTVLNKKLSYTQTSRSSHYYCPKTDMVDTSESDKESIINSLKEKPNFSLWSIYAPCTTEKWTKARKTDTESSLLKFKNECSDADNPYHQQALTRLKEIYCSKGRWTKARKTDTEKSLLKFMRQCDNSTNQYYRSALTRLKEIYCSKARWTQARKTDTESSLSKFTNECTDRTNKYYKGAVTRLKLIRELKDKCSKTNWDAAFNKKTVASLTKFTESCTNKNNQYYILAQQILSVQSAKKVEPPKVVVEKRIAVQTDKPQTIIVPTGSLGEISEVRKKILEKTLESKLDEYFAIVPKNLFEEAQEQVFQEMESDECTEEQCIMMIRELLQVENAFQLVLMVDEGNTQISLTWNGLDEKRVEEVYCEECKTKELRQEIESLVEKLVLK